MFNGVEMDVGVFGSCSGQLYEIFARYPPLVMYLAATGMFFYLLSGHANVMKANTISIASVSCFIIARTFRGCLQFFWRERGRVTFLRVMEQSELRAPAALKGWSTVHIIFADIIILPLCVAISAFHNIGIFKYIGFFFYPHHQTHLWGIAVIPLSGLVLSIIHYAVLLPMDRRNPYFFIGWKDYMARIISAFSAWLGIPTLSILSALLPCDGKTMRFVESETCLSSFHRWSIGIGIIIVLLYSLVLDIAMGSLSRSGGSTFDERRCDGLMLQLMLFHRYAYIFIAIFANNPIWYILLCLLSILLFLKLIKTPFSSAKVLDDLTKVSLLLCVLSSLCCLLTLFLQASTAVWVWFSVCFIVALFLFAALLFRYGLRLCESDSDVWVSEI